MIYYVGYVIHNEVARKNLKAIADEFWIDWPTDDRMELTFAGDVAILSIEAGAYEFQAGPLSVNTSQIHYFDPIKDKLNKRIEADTLTLISAIDKLNELAVERPELLIPADSRDGIRFFAEQSVYT